MEALKDIPPSFKDAEVVPDNGFSPYTGYIVFRATHNKYGKIAVKFGQIPKNNHKSLWEEYQISRDIVHTSIVDVYDFIRETWGDLIIMEDLPYGGRRSRWREIIMKWNYEQLLLFIKQMFNIIFWIDFQSASHNDIEFANIGARDENYAPVLFDFGRIQKVNPNPDLVKENLSLHVKSGYNAWARELFGIGGKYEKEGPMLNQDPKGKYDLLIRNYGKELNAYTEKYS